MLKRGERVSEEETLTKDEWDEFYVDYCPKCSWSSLCDGIEFERLRRLDNGRLSCTRYRCAATDW